MINVVAKGSFINTRKFFRKASSNRIRDILVKYAYQGVEHLAEYTPKRTGLTSRSWGFEITESNGIYTITWTNSNIQRGINIALLIANGHATRSGAWVSGVEYIDPALEPVFKKMADDAWMEVTGDE